MRDLLGTWICVVLASLPCSLSDFNAFSDDVLFGINWPGQAPGELDLASSDLSNLVKVTTPNNEQYVCVVPDNIPSSHDSDHSYKGPDAKTLLKPLFDQASCSYRIESYWTYELCHGKLLRQYHEEKEMLKKPKLQEYFLGRGTDTPKEADETPAEEVKPKKKKVPKKVDGTEIPYYEVLFEDGTLCDLHGRPRRASLRYVCQPEGKGEIYEIKEVSTCEYEVVVLTSLLCAHPDYQVKKDHINSIKCHSIDGSPPRPKSLENLERETNLGKYNRKEATGSDRPEASRIQAITSKGSKISAATDKQLLHDFLTGQHCIQGGTGWWKHEFCYGKTVIQYHDEPSGRTNVLLGMWHVEDHLLWLKEQPSKRPKPKGMRRHISQMYTMGDICDITGKRRIVEVKLKCKENTSQPHAVAIYLVEPSVCEYILVVESNIFCSILDLVDENGMIPVSAIPKP